jgi:hypothetical protein
MLAAIQAARGEFLFFATDNDVFFSRGVLAASEGAARFAADASIIGVTGLYVVEDYRGSFITTYPNLDSVDMADRVSGYVGTQSPNVLFYSAIRRSAALSAWEFMRAHPFRFPFHDQVVVLLYLLSGRMVDVKRFVFGYDHANWETATKTASQAQKYYETTGMDPAFRRLHWLLCGFEGTKIILASRHGSHHPPEQRQKAASRWFEVMFSRFVADKRVEGGSRFGREAEALCEKWRQNSGNFILEDLAADIYGFIGLFAPEKARLYRDFWKSLSADVRLERKP